MRFVLVLLLSLIVTTSQAAAGTVALAWDFETWRDKSPDAPFRCDYPFWGRSSLPLETCWFDPTACTLQNSWFGARFFSVNGSVVPTHADEERDESLRGRGAIHGEPTTIWEKRYLHSPFSTTLLSIGPNRIAFDSTGYVDRSTPSSVVPGEANLRSVIRLSSSGIGRRTLLDERKCGILQRRSFDVSLSLAEIEPELAAKLEAVLEALRHYRDGIITLATDVEDDIQQNIRLTALERAMVRIFEEGFEAISVDALNQLFQEFVDVFDAMYAGEIATLLSDLKAQIQDLRDQHDEEIGRLLDNLNSTASDALSEAEASGFEPYSDGTYQPPSGQQPAPDVPLPPVVGEWPADQDSYAAYADATLSRLRATMAGEVVTDRAQFLSILDEWNAVQDEYERILRNKPGLSPEEFKAFFLAQREVLDFSAQYIDEERWFRDSSVPSDIRGLEQLFRTLNWAHEARQLRRAFVGWRGPLTPAQRAIVEVLRFGEATIRELRIQPVPEISLWSLTRGLVNSAFSLAVDVGIGFTPIGDFLDACELVTGWRGCDWDATPLSLEERLLSGVGIFVLGSTALWRRVADRMPCFPGITRAWLTISSCGRLFVKSYADAVGSLNPRRPKTGVLSTARADGGGTWYHMDASFGNVSVKWKSNGFPEFELHRYAGSRGRADVRIEYSGSRTTDFGRADAEAGFNSSNPRPEGFTWHHHEDIGRMVLIDSRVHDLPHNGGVAIWQQMTGRRYN